MFKRFLCVIVSCVIAFSVITLPVSASSNSDLSVIASNLSGFLTSFKSNYSSYKSGSISFSDFLTNVASEANKRGLATGIVLTNAVDLADFMHDLCSQIDVSFDDFWNDFYSQRHDLSNDDSILKGYGAVAQLYLVTSGEWQFTYYGEYGLISANNYAFMMNGYWIAYSGVSKSFDSTQVQNLNDTSYYICRLYGDWRFEDGSSAADITTEIPDKPVPGYDDDSVSQDDLIDFIADLINQLALNFPDLSTVEGLLSSILSQLQSINGKMDDLHVTATVDNLSEIKTYLDMSIASLVVNGNSNNTELYNELVKIREAIKGIDSNSAADWAELAKLLGLTIDDSDIDSETGLIKDAVISSIVDALFKFFDLLFDRSSSDSSSVYSVNVANSSFDSLDDSGYSSYSVNPVNAGVTHPALSKVKVLADVKELGTTGIRLLSSFVDLIITLDSSLKFQTINLLMNIIHGFIFDGSKPSDLSFTFDYNGQSSSFTILSASFLDNQYVSVALTIVRSFVGLVIIYSWLKWARSFFLSSI